MLLTTNIRPRIFLNHDLGVLSEAFMQTNIGGNQNKISITACYYDTFINIYEFQIINQLMEKR